VPKTRSSRDRALSYPMTGAELFTAKSNHACQMMAKTLVSLTRPGKFARVSRRIVPVAIDMGRSQYMEEARTNVCKKQ